MGLEEAPTISERAGNQQTSGQVAKTVEERQRQRLSLAQKLRLVNLAEHYRPTEASRELGVGRDTVYYWRRRYQEGGSEALRTRPRGKAEPRTVTPEVKQRLLELKAENPKRSSAKVARLFEEESKLRIHRTTVWSVLNKGAPRSSP